MKRIIKFLLPVFHSNAKRNHCALQTADRRPYNDSSSLVAFIVRKGIMSEPILVSSVMHWYGTGCHFKAVLQAVYRITELKKRPGSNKGYRAIEE
jgi:hypothetical protein